MRFLIYLTLGVTLWLLGFYVLGVPVCNSMWRHMGGSVILLIAAACLGKM